MSLSIRDGLARLSTLAAAAVLLLAPVPALAQVAGANQSIFNDEEQLMNINAGQAQQYAREKQRAEQSLQEQEEKNAPYRLYAQKTIEKAKKEGGKAEESNQVKLLEEWLQRDDAYKAKQMAYINQLSQALSEAQRGQQNTVQNLQSDIMAMRQNVQDQKDAAKFNRMMKVNYFNELQSEMGAASWGRPPGDGTYNSVGGYGMMGGYGYSAMGRHAMY